MLGLFMGGGVLEDTDGARVHVLAGVVTGQHSFGYARTMKNATTDRDKATEM